MVVAAFPGQRVIVCLFAGWSGHTAGGDRTRGVGTPRPVRRGAILSRRIAARLDSARPRRLRRALAMLMLWMLLATACSGENADGADITNPPSTPVSLGPIPSEDRPTTTMGTTTTTDPAQAAADAALARSDAWYRCALNPPECDPWAALSPTNEGESLEGLVATIEAWKTEDYAIAANPAAGPARWEILGSEIDDVFPGEAVVRICEVDTLMIVDRGAGPDGDDVIVSDGISTVVADLDMRIGEDGRWRVYETILVERLDGEVSCSGHEG